ncbi:MAG: hypothetical protein JSV75_05605 [Candidatus Bathyarchaeota archaeon]|nr:MAG: hypothetical protein JSV75_05605 [Candidatus Bathyarchaeota archaeon]
MSETLEIPLKETKEWLEQETLSIVEPLRFGGKKLLDGVRAKLDAVIETSDKLLDDAEREIAKGSRKTYRRAKIMVKFTKNTSEMIEETIIPEEISQESLSTIVEELDNVLGTVVREREKWFPAVSPFFIIDRRRFDVALKRAMDSLKELRSFSSEEYSMAADVETVFSRIDKLSNSLDELSQIEKNKKRMELRKETLEKKIEETQQLITATRGQNEIVELAQLNEEIKDLEEKVKHNLRYLQKPFLKLQSLVLSSRYNLFLDEQRKLEDYLNKPFKALATEEGGYPLLRKILQKMDNAIAQGKLRLKKSRLKKAQDQLDKILNSNTLLSLHQSCMEAFAKKQELSTSRTITKSRKELTQLQRTLKGLQKRRELLTSKDSVLDRRIKKDSKRIEAEKKELENIIFELTDESVRILL